MDAATITPRLELPRNGGVLMQRMVRLPSKPRSGEACNGCGLCCSIELCVAGDMMFPGAKAPCPALKITPDGTRTYCQLVMVEKAYALEPMLQTALGIGTGCTMPDEPDARQPNE